MYLTKRQREVLDFIEQFINDRGYSPSLEEIGEGVGLRSLATIHKHLQNLEDKGFIARSWNRGRSIEVKQTEISPVSDASLELPLYGKVAAGFPIEAMEESEPEVVAVPAQFVRRAQDTFCLRVEGDSMIDEQINNGDLIIVERRQSANNGETIVALVDGEEATVKKFYREPGNQIRLQPANERLSPMIYPADRVQIQGIVVGLMRHYL